MEWCLGLETEEDNLESGMDSQHLLHKMYPYSLNSNLYKNL